MPTVDGFKVPEFIEAQWRGELQDADDDVLLAFAKSRPELAKGARLTVSGVPLIRKRLVSRATGKGELSEALRDLLATCGLDLKFIAVLSEEALELGFNPLAGIYGFERFLAGMLVDHREGVREQAVEILQQEDLPEEMDLPEALETAERTFGRFLTSLAEWTAAYDDAPLDPEVGAWLDSEAPDHEPPLATPRGLAREIEDLKEQLAEAKQKRAGEKALQKKIDKLQAKIDAQDLQQQRLASELDGRNAEVLSLKQALKQAEKKSSELREQIDSRVSARVDEELHSIKRSWFRDAQELDAKWRASREGVDDVLAASEAALTRQAEADRHSGNLRQIRERLATLRATHDALRRAGADALSPLPEVAAATESVAREITRLEGLLPRPAPSRTDLADAFDARILAAESPDELGRLAGLLDELIEQKLLTPADGRAVYTRLNHTMGKLYDRFMPKAVTGPSEAATDPICFLRAAAVGQVPAILLLDGHNVLFALSDLFEGSLDEKGIPGAAARKALLERLRPFVAAPSRCETRLYYDGPTRSERNHDVNLTEIYSGGGTTDQRADRIIVEYLEYCARNRSATPRILVTNDRDLAGQARSQGARTLSATRFSALLEEVSP